MDIRIVNGEGNMYAVGERTLRTTGNVLGLISSDGKFEPIQAYADTIQAEGVKKGIILKIKENITQDVNGIVINLGL